MSTKTKKNLTKKIQIPQEVSVKMDQNIIVIKSLKGTLQRKISNPIVDVSIQDDKIVVSTKQKSSKNNKRMINTIVSHIKNMLEGVKQEYIYKLKIISGHFPMNVSLEKDTVLVKNFFGEKVPRKAKVLSGVKAEIKGDEIIITSIDKELAGQTAANIEMATRITNKDRRVFSNGIFITQKAHKEIL